MGVPVQSCTAQCRPTALIWPYGGFKSQLKHAKLAANTTKSTQLFYTDAYEF